MAGSPESDLRRSTRKRKSRNQAIGFPIDGDDDTEPDYEEKQHGVRQKRQKTTRVTRRNPTSAGGTMPAHWRNVRGRHGALRQLVEMPLDILFEIFRQLDSADILHLSRTSKALRNILTKSSASFVWKCARNNVNLPDCPEDMNEMQYAKLMFDSTCDYCSAATAQTIVWQSYTRACKNCLMDGEKFSQERRGLPTGLIPLAKIHVGNGRYRREEIVFCFRTGNQLLEEYNSLDEGARLEWVEEKLKIASYRSKVGRECDAWTHSKGQERSANLENIRESRYAAVKIKLADAGWGDEVNKLSMKFDQSLKYHKLVWQPKALTDRIWRNIEPTIIALMEDFKTERLKNEYRALRKVRCGILKDAYYVYLASLPLHAIVPGLADVALLPEFKAMINAPMEETTTADNLAAATVAVLPGFTIEWQASKERDLVELARVKGIEISEADLHRPFVRFGCWGCRKHFEYPRILVHQCLTEHSYYYSPQDSEQESLNDLQCRPWNHTRSVVFEAGLYRNSLALLQTCGFDANTVILDDLDNDSTVFECLDCYDVGKGRALLFWEQAVAHLDGAHRPAPQMQRADLDDKERIMVRAAWVERKEGRLSKEADIHSPRWLCVTCRQRCKWYELERHLSTQHGKVAPFQKGEDYVLHLDGPVSYCTNKYDIVRGKERPEEATLQ